MHMDFLATVLRLLDDKGRAGYTRRRGAGVRLLIATP